MKKKTFFQVSIILYSALLLFLGFMAAGIYVIIEFFISKVGNASAYDWIGMLAGLFAVIFMGYTFIRMERNRIILNKSEIFVPENWGNKNNKIQYETHIFMLKYKKYILFQAIRIH